ncbi:LysR family transcriptional regulator [Bacillus horti]|uniref:LysR family transcriptional activator of glutamate synthase operon n=1 Tax=Caldalkalibacillus horti TaxID=77523 RepID=A0ABT9VU36_9BACI|nr:LysR family transcriptional regulator [Bacillus horti]MDQ0164489.1 LysR family transcriptional activator of glutamate synthase operon [Bacillus horti]
MELRQLKYFIEVARLEHVTRAAEELLVAQSAVSKQISNLETELGVQLFVREGRNVRLTPIGKAFLERIKKVMAELDQAIQEVNEFMDPELGEIRLGFPHSLAAYTLPIVVSAFREKHPNVSFELRQGMYTQLLRDIIQGEIDLALVSPVPEKHPEVEGHVLFTEDIYALLPPQHVLAKEGSIRLEQLKQEPFVVFRSGFTMRTIVMEACEKAGFTPKIAFEGEETDTIRGLVAAGLGVGLLPAVAINESGPINPAYVKISEPEVTRTVGYITSRSRKLLPAERLFRIFLAEYYHRK